MIIRHNVTNQIGFRRIEFVAGTSTSPVLLPRPDVLAGVGRNRSRDLSRRRPCPNQADNFVCLRWTVRVFLRVDLLAIHENAKRAGSPGTQANRKAEFTFNIVLETHGLSLDVRSKEAAPDLDSHKYPLLKATW
jgi:hypothetical protein